MKVAHICYVDKGGGAPIAAMRLHQALQKAGVDSTYLCLRKKGDDPSVNQLGSFLTRFINKIVCRVIQELRLRIYGPEGSFNIFHSGLAKEINACDADVVHLHWVNAEMMSIAEIGRIKKPVVWTFHDMWPFCGAEHYTDDNRYVTGYQSLEFRVQSSELGEKRSDSMRHAPRSMLARVDLDRWVFRRKQKHWRNWRPHIVTPSNWLAECVRNSVLFGKSKVGVIPNCLDINIFKPLGHKDGLRAKYGLPLDKKIILFGAVDPDERRKGGDLLAAALAKIEDHSGYALVVFGADNGLQIAGVEMFWMGRVNGDSSMAELYNCADVVCIPSRQEAFGQTASEPLACGVPVVAFNCTGLKDVVDHQENGYLADPFDAEDFARGIEWVLSGGRKTEDGRRRTEGGLSAKASATAGGQTFEDGGVDLAGNARKKAKCCFAPEIVAKQYVAVYKAVLVSGRGEI